MSNPEIKEYEYDRLENLEVDSIAKENPKMNKSVLNLLVEDIKENGQQEPILIHDGKVIDGRNRLDACKELKQSIKVIELTGTREEAIKKAKSSNDMRRHLSKSQYAIMAASTIMDSRTDAQGKEVKKDDWLKVEDVKEVKEGRTSSRLVEDAIRVIKAKSTLNKIQSVRSGSMTVSEAITAINKEKEKKKNESGENTTKTAEDYRAELETISTTAAAAYDTIIKDRKQTKVALANEVVKLRLELEKLKAK